MDTLTPGFQIALNIEEHVGLERSAELVRISVPLPRGLLRDTGDVQIIDASQRALPHQARELGWWPDGSVKWLLLDVLVALGAGRRDRLLMCLSPPAKVAAVATRLQITSAKDNVRIDTGAAVFEIRASGAELFIVASGSGNPLLRDGARLQLTDCRGHHYEGRISRLRLEESGPIRASVVVEGNFHGSRACALQFKIRLAFVAGASHVSLECGIRNSRAARHPGGLWDLADRGAVQFKDISLRLTPRSPARSLRWYAVPGEQLCTQEPGPWSIYQDSSGGKNWDSDNHMDARGAPTVTFRGYQVWGATTASQREPLSVATGERANPCLCLVTQDGQIAATTRDFWQNFPKALRWKEGVLEVSLFPRECRAPYVLQGGEQKRHTVLLDFARADAANAIPQLQQPLVNWIDPSWVEASGVMGRFVAADRDHNLQYLDYIGAILDGPHAFEHKREIIDEYGWRNFGDLYADHEAVQHTGSRPLVSHYNNQYDFIFGALVHFLRTGDSRWRGLAEAAARHTVDIDIYHTDGDKAAFNHGLFWHTDHYEPAATCTHRTYSRRNARGRRYGGGPSNEHNYTSGLLLCYYLSGDPEMSAAVMELADWVIAMDDGTRNIFGLIDAGFTGLASQTVTPDFQGPGRGAGNSINALLDAYQLSRGRHYLDKAEQLIRRCIHPADDVAAFGFSEPEYRWSYLVFLQVLGKYLDFKVEWGEKDYMFHYARVSLLRYGRWMALHEVPYGEVLHKVKLPTETWSAHDVRKCHVLHLAALHAPTDERPRLHAQASTFFERCLKDLLAFKTAFLTRPLVVLCVYGHIEAYFQAHPLTHIEADCPIYDFGVPERFVPQRHRLVNAVRSKLRLIGAQLRRLAP